MSNKLPEVTWLAKAQQFKFSQPGLGVIHLAITFHGLILQ